MSVLSSIFYFIVALGILITVHEFGHFWVARKVGVKVLRFSIGFGKPLWKRQGKVDGTEYVVAAIPLGGYVKMLDEREGEVAENELHRAFNRQRLAARVAIVAAGPIFNFLFAIVAYWLIFVIGVTGMKPIVGDVAPGSLAEAGGFQRGDEIVAVAGTETPTWEPVVFALLDRVLDSNKEEIEVRDMDGRSLIRWIDMGAVSIDDMNSGNLLSQLGLSPQRPQVPAVIGRLLPAGAAEQAGMAVGDRVIAADGGEIADWEAWVNYVRARPEQTIQITVQRSDGSVEQLAITPAREAVDGEDIGRIGAAVQMPENFLEEVRAEVRYSPLEAVWKAMVKTWDMSLLTLRMIGKMVVGEVSTENLSGPISIAQYAGYSASVGFIPFLTFLALISISLGVLNFLPIPMLDGGHLFYYALEYITGKPLSDEVQMVGQQVGIVLLLGLMVFAFYNDIARLLS
ncbi:MAG: sigma E protease regulator RseP [Gammaproteobacteria bacterium]|nr:sigma E protease regulator RseP [Gammaproteobacteria bacterium]